MIMMINKVLIIRFSSFGDIVQCSAVVELIRQKYPDAQIDWVTRSEFDYLVKLNSHVNHVWSFNKKEGLVVPLPPPVFVPSKYVFVGKDNNVMIALPDAATRKMSIKFYEEDNSFLFELSKINESYLIMEKVNFLHTGWFYFSLYENDILVEKSKFLIQKDAKVSSNLKEQRNK